MARQFVLKASIAGVGDVHKALVHQKIEISINGWFCQGRGYARINLGAAQVPTGFVQRIKNRHALFCQAESLFSNLISKVLGGTGHTLL